MYDVYPYRASTLLISAARLSPPLPSNPGVALAEQSTKNSIRPLNKFIKGTVDLFL